MTTATIDRPEAAQGSDPMSLVTEQVVERFERDGAVWIPGLLSPAWLKLIAQGVQRNLNSPGPNLIRHFEGEPGEYHDDYGNYLVIPEYQRLVADSPIAGVMARILRTEKLWLFLDQIFVKEGGASRRTPWHQDIPWLMADGQFATMWIALQPLSAEETLECVAGSHRGPVYDHGTDSKGNQVSETNGRPPIPDIDAEPAKWPIISHASRPGDVLIFHPQTLHGGGAMKEGGSRRSLNLRFFGDETHYVEREDGHSPEFHGVSEILRHGDLLRHPWFPQVYPRAATGR